MVIELMEEYSHSVVKLCH